jgi:hypothetical protein
MDGVLDHLKRELAGVRTGRPSVTLLDSVHVEAYGTTVPLNQVAALSIPDATSMVAQPFDPSLMAAIEKAIRAAVELDVRAIACSDQDDVWLPPKLQVLWDALENMPDMSLVHSDMRIIHSRPDSDEDTLAKETAWTLERRNPANVDPAFMLLRNNVSGCSMLMHATLARNYPIVPDAFAFHDHWFAVAAAHHGGIGHTRSALLLHRQHGGNTVGARRAPTVAHRIRQVGVRQVIRNMLAAHGAYLSRIEACRSQGLSPMGQISKHHDRTFRIPFILTLCAYSLRHAYSDPFLAKEALKVAIGTLVK